MGNGELKEKVAAGVAWSIAEKVGSMLLQMAVSLIVARLLMPEDIGVMAILTFFTAVALVVVDSGFSQTLIRRKDNPTDEEYMSVFMFNIAMSAVLYVVLVAVSPLVAAFYNQPVITEIAPVLFLLLPVNALCVIQNTIFTRQFRFGLLSRATFASSLTAGIVAIGMALAGCGVWSLVGQRLTSMVVKAAILWFCSSWRPGSRFSTAPVREMAPFSLRLMSTDIISSVYNNVASLFIGKIYSADALGYFNQAQKLKDLPVTSTMQAVQSVTYPALSKIDGDERKFAESYRQVMMVVAFVMFPMMAGIVAVADDLFMLLLGAKWMPTVPYLCILCITGLFYPPAMISYNILKVRSDGQIILRLEIVKKIIMTAILVITIPQSVKAVAWGLAAMSLCELIVNFTASQRYVSLSLLRMVRTLLPTIMVTAAMYAVVILIGRSVAGYGEALRLLVMIATGVITYIVLALAFRLEAAREIIDVVRRMTGKN